MKRCPHCRQLDHADAIMCKHCMRHFAEPVTPPARATGKAGDAAKKPGASTKAKPSPLGSLIALVLIAGVAAGVMFPELRDQLIARYVMQEPASDPTSDTAPPSDPAVEPAPSPEPPPSPPPAPRTESQGGTAQEAGVGSAVAARDEGAALARAEARRAAEEARRASRGRSAPTEPKPNPLRVVPVPSDPPPVTEPAATSVPSATTAGPVQPLRVGGNIKAPAKIRDAKPEYPRVAVSARVQGVVIIEATISPSGNVQDARVLRSIPLLDQAALDAVKQWRYEPTLLNGARVPVIMTVTVNFRLE